MQKHLGQEHEPHLLQTGMEGVERRFREGMSRGIISIGEHPQPQAAEDTQMESATKKSIPPVPQPAFIMLLFPNRKYYGSAFAQVGQGTFEGKLLGLWM